MSAVRPERAGSAADSAGELALADVGKKVEARTVISVAAAVGVTTGIGVGVAFGTVDVALGSFGVFASVAVAAFVGAVTLGLCSAAAALWGEDRRGCVESEHSGRADTVRGGVDARGNVPQLEGGQVVAKSRARPRQPRIWG